ncbi:sulfurtransferase TusA family protein [Parvularcula maris]|uniref:Sulfurtransferase TusA family protein n=1 Tax=Parvularcula maris TaxID=2965077 RepID=A0A9X2L8N8_9PROT|nr:sulfurtransferase TusA family protein [Parvularcula maris]MCQ8185121.1 sulfurtransferase TusA family protein [Parvularcula maris]
MANELDLRGLRCPLPVLKLEAAMRRMARGESMVAVADDPLAKLDLPHAAKGAGFVCEPVALQDPEAFAYRVSAPDS